MALIQEYEKSGNLLFKYRGQIPVLIFALALPILFVSNKSLYWLWIMGGIDTPRAIVVIVAILVSLLGFVIRCYTIGTTPHGTSGRNTDKQVAEQLNTKGIYSIVRHPLYLGNYLMWAGLLIFTMNVWCFVIVSLLYWLYYERIMFAEEQFLTKNFGQTYVDWSMTVPPFLPALRQFVPSDIPFSFKAVLRREYSSLFSMVFAFTLTDYLLFFIRWRYLSLIIPNFPCDWHTCIRPSLFVLVAMFVLMMVLRTLKHHTSVLNPNDNRD